MRDAFRRSSARVRLLVLDHLQAMFERAQEAIGVASVRRRPFRVTSPRARRAHRARPASPRGRSAGIAAAEDQLLRLGEEFDLADAAAAQLDVVPGDRDRAVAFMRMDLPLDRMDVLDRRVVEIAPPDERLDRFEKVARRFADRRRRRAP